MDLKGRILPQRGKRLQGNVLRACERSSNLHLVLIDDVFQFISLTTIREMWRRLEPLLGQSRPCRRQASEALSLGKDVMYSAYIMRRTQIYLTEEQGQLLERRSKASGQTISDLIRAAIDSMYSPRRRMSRAQKVRVAQQTAGSWKNGEESGAEYVERIRGSRRLARLHHID